MSYAWVKLALPGVGLVKEADPSRDAPKAGGRVDLQRVTQLGGARPGPKAASGLTNDVLYSRSSHGSGSNSLRESETIARSAIRWTVFPRCPYNGNLLPAGLSSAFAP